MMNYSNTEEQLARAAFFLGNIHNVNASIFSMSNRSNLESKFKSDKINNEDAKAGKSLISGELKEWISATLDFIPLIGNIKSGVEAIFGVDPITGRKLKKWEQALSAAAIIGGPAAKAAKHAGKLAVKGGKTLQQQGGKLVQQGGKLVEKGGNLLGKAADLLDSSRTQLAGAGAGLGKFSVSTGISAGKKTTGGSKQVGNSTKQTTSSKPTQQGSQNIKSDKQQTNKQVREVKYGEHIITGKNGRKELAPNVRYVTEDGYKYTTDEFGRIVEVEADNLILKTAERKPHMQRVAGREDRLPEDQGGHLIATQFHGSGDIDNLVAMHKEINKSGGEWYKMEQVWANALKEGKRVSVKIQPVYEGKSLRPSSFKITYKVEGDDTVNKIIENKSGG